MPKCNQNGSKAISRAHGFAPNPAARFKLSFFFVPDSLPSRLLTGADWTKEFPLCSGEIGSGSEPAGLPGVGAWGSLVKAGT